MEIRNHKKYQLNYMIPQNFRERTQHQKNILLSYESIRNDKINFNLMVGKPQTKTTLLSDLDPMALAVPRQLSSKSISVVMNSIVEMNFLGQRGRSLEYEIVGDKRCGQVWTIVGVQPWIFSFVCPVSEWPQQQSLLCNVIQSIHFSQDPMVVSHLPVMDVFSDTLNLWIPHNILGCYLPSSLSFISHDDEQQHYHFRFLQSKWLECRIDRSFLSCERYIPVSHAFI